MNQKTIYLTVDDAPSKDFRGKVDFLNDKKIPALFFCEGKKLEEKWRDVVYAINKGFIIGNHSYNHQTFSTLSLEEAKEEIVKTDRIIEELYKKVGIDRPVKVFRFPYGDKGGGNKQGIQKILTDLGYRQPDFKGITYSFYYEYCLDKDNDVFWTFDFEEYKLKDWGLILGKVNKPDPMMGGSLLNTGSSDIVLVHDHEDTGDLFLKIIEKLLSEYFVFGQFSS